MAARGGGVGRDAGGGCGRDGGVGSGGGDCWDIVVAAAQTNGGIGRNVNFADDSTYVASQTVVGHNCGNAGDTFIPMDTCRQSSSKIASPTMSISTLIATASPTERDDSAFLGC